MTSLDVMRLKEKLLRRLRGDLEESMDRAETTWVGKTIGFKIPEDIRIRLDKQAVSWGLASNKKTVLTALVLGLKQMEFLSGLKGEEPVAPRGEEKIIPIRSAQTETLNDDEDSMAEVSPILGTNGEGDDPLSASRGGGDDLSRG
jgi:hypothetical protein